ncbi:MAG TPA: 50S ribosomal protein L32e [Candidatus Aenigmarchaeota archaeon]|nr:50S ribosomal protein L32e [Candidatus Aenigmarchaeota archaeon]
MLIKHDVKKCVMSMLRIRKRIKKKKPAFRRQEGFKHAKLGDSWRRPKGRHSKLRMREKSRGKVPCIGYSSPKSVRGLDRFGYREIRVFNVRDLENINPEEEVAVISGTVGKKKRMEIVKAAEQKKIIVKNF